jgi:hypothetical protein
MYWVASVALTAVSFLDTVSILGRLYSSPFLPVAMKNQLVLDAIILAGPRHSAVQVAQDLPSEGSTMVELKLEETIAC